MSDFAESRGWVVVLGASSGFGGAVSTKLAAEGFDVCGVHLDRRATLPAAEAVRESIEASGRRALFFNVNAVDAEKRSTVLDALAEHAEPGAVRLLFHSLAFGALRPLVGDDASGSIRAAQISMTLDVMANSLVHWAQEAVWRGLMADGGRILAMTSAGSTRAAPAYGAVSAAKAALEAYVRQLALELGPRGITANAIRAGVTDTPAVRKIPDADRLMATARALNPAGRLTTPEDVADLVSILIEPAARWVSGNVIGVDGGEDIAAP